MIVDRTLRILCIAQHVYPDSYGGVQRVVHEIATRLAARGHDIDLVGQRGLADSPGVEERDGLTIYRYGTLKNSERFGGRTLTALRGSRGVLASLLAAHRYDIVLPHHFFPYYAYARVTGRKNAPEIMTFHASFWQELRFEGAERRVAKPLESVLFGRLARHTEVTCLKRADRVVVLSEFSRDQLASYYPFAEDKVVKIPGGVDLDRFRPSDDRAALRASLDLPAEGAVLLTARRLVPRMGLRNLIEAFAGVRRSNPDIYLIIAGHGRLEGDLRRLASDLGVAEHVRFTGFVADDELVRLYQAADLFVLPTVAFEGFGMVTLEALACGTPAVGTPIGATPEILRPLASQLVLEGTKPKAIDRGIRVMLEWLSDRDAAAGLRGRCREYALERFGWESAVDSLEALIDRTLSDRGSR
jgi:glycosyltransferase involved in cell wall biosynthesis